MPHMLGVHFYLTTCNYLQIHGIPQQHAGALSIDHIDGLGSPPRQTLKQINHMVTCTSIRNGGGRVSTARPHWSSVGQMACATVCKTCHGILGRGNLLTNLMIQRGLDKLDEIRLPRSKYMFKMVDSGGNETPWKRSCMKHRQLGVWDVPTYI